MTAQLVRSLPDAPWFSGERYPFTESAEQRLVFVARRAVLIPPAPGMRSWRFHVGGNTLEMVADPPRRGPVADLVDREQAILCGVALGGIRLALDALGEVAAVDLVPDPARPDVLARVRLLGHRDRVDSDAERFVALVARPRAGHRMVGRGPIPTALVREMVSAAAHEGLTMVTIPARGRPPLAVLATASDTPDDWLRVGQALARVLLVAHAAGLAVATGPDARPGAV
jgi:hypothetical protein